MPKINIERGKAGVRAPGLASPNRNDPLSQAKSERASQQISAGEELRLKEAQAAASAYVANQAIKVNEAIDQLNLDLQKQYDNEIAEGTRSDYSGYQEDFVNRSKDIMNNSISNAPNSIAQNSLFNNFANKTIGLNANSKRQELSSNINLYKSQFDENIQIISNKLLVDPSSISTATQDVETLISALPTYLSKQDGKALADDALKKLANSYVQGLTRENPADVKEAVKDPLIQEYLTKATIESALRAAEQEEVIQAKQQRAEADKFHSDFIEAQKLRVINGELGASGITSLLEGGAINTQEFGQLENLYNSRQKEKDKLAGLQSFGASVINGDTTIIPTDKGDRSAANDYYENFIKPVRDQLKPEEQLSQDIQFVDKFKVIPDSMKREFQQVFNGDPRKRVVMAKKITEITNLDPVTRNQVEREVKAAFQLLEKTEAGLTPEEATEAVDKFLLQENTPEFRMRNELANKTLNEVSFDPDKLDPVFTSQPDRTPIEMNTDFQQHIRTAITELGIGPDAAEAYAYHRMDSTWGITKVNGRNSWVKHSPEKTTGLKTEQITEIFRNNVASIVGVKENLDDFFLSGEPVINSDGTYSYKVFKEETKGFDVDTGIFDFFGFDKEELPMVELQVENNGRLEPVLFNITKRELELISKRDTTEAVKEAKEFRDTFGTEKDRSNRKFTR